MYTVQELFDLSHTMAKEYLSLFKYPWEAISGIKELIVSLGAKLSKEEFTEASENIWIHKTASVSSTAYIAAPCIIGAKTEIRHCAFIRSSALIGNNCVIGNSVELKNVILFDNVQTPHYNDVGDSILGYCAHMGAGSITSNVKSDKSLITVRYAEERFDTGLKKFGAAIGDFAEIGCNSVLNPGTVIGKHSNIYPLSSVRGTVFADRVFKDYNNIVLKN